MSDLVPQASGSVTNLDATVVFETPAVEVVEEKIDVSPNSANSSPAEMVEISAVFVEETHSLGARLLQVLERTKSLNVPKKDEIGLPPRPDSGLRLSAIFLAQSVAWKRLTDGRTTMHNAGRVRG